MSNQHLNVALTYHAETKHSYDSVYRHHHFLDWDNQPRTYKHYTSLTPIALPQPVPATHIPALLTLAPTTPAATSSTFPTLADLSYVLCNAAGVTKRRVIPGHGEMLFRAAACTGALYHIELYIAVADAPELPAGVYHFSPVDSALRCVRQGDFRHTLVAATSQEAGLAQAPVIIIGTDMFWRNAWKYRSRTYRHSFWDAGTILANLLAASTARRLPAQLALGFVDAEVNAVLSLEVPREVSLFLVGLGDSQAQPLPSPAVEPLHLDVLPLSAEEVEYPAIHLMHTASSLDSPEEVALWRGAAPPSALPTAASGVALLPSVTEAMVPTAPLEHVIRQRGSARKFRHQTLSLMELSTLLVQTTQIIPADFLESPDARLNDLYLIVNAVTDLPSGTYVFHPGVRGLELLEAGDFRYQAGVLALGQSLAADASVNVYFLCDLPLLLERYGNRGYRAAQLEAGILGGRMYLAAYALGFAATGLTFFDDDVSNFFSPHAAEKSVMFLIAIGHTRKRHE